MHSPRSFFLPLLALAFTGAAMLTLAVPHGRLESGHGEHEESEAAAKLAQGDWFYAQRAYPFGEIPSAKVDEARAQAALMAADAPGLTAATAWQQVGPFNIGGRVTALAAKPGSTTIWLGSACGGVWKSTNGGTNWSPTGLAALSGSIGALALDPTNDQVLYVGTGEANGAVDTYDGDGMYVTRDGGSSWNYLGLYPTRRIAAIAIDPSDPQRVFVAAMGSQFSTSPDRGLYRSTNGGKTWSRVLFVNDSTGVCDVVINPAHPETMFCATWERVRRSTYRRAFGPGCGIWRSANGGTTWTKLAGGLPPSNDDLGRIALAIAPSRPGTVYAQIGTGARLGYRGLGFYRSLDGGDTWTRRDVGATFANAFGGFVWYFGEMGVDPVNPDRVWALGQNLLRSDDGGVNFTGALGGAHVDQHAIWIDAANPARVLLGNDGGFYASTTGGGAWTKSLDLPITQFYAGSVAAYDATKVMGGTQDNNSLLTRGSPSGWFPTLDGDGFYALSDPADPNVLFTEWQYACDRQGIMRSTDDGANFYLAQGFDPGDRYNWCTPYAMSPTNHNVMICGSHRLYRSVDNGVSFYALSGDLTRAIPTTLAFSTISTVEISAADGNLFLAGTDDGRVWKSPNGGSSWTEITSNLPVRSITRVASDPVDANVLYVTLSGFGQDESLAHVYRSTNQGVTWTSIAGNLPDIPVNDLVVDPLDRNTLYVGTDIGVYKTRDLGSSWWAPGAGLPIVPVLDLELHAGSRQLFAFTHGRSAWKLDLGALPTAAPGPAPDVALGAPAPNPSRGPVRITLTLERDARLDAGVFDAQGRRVAALASGARSAGLHTLTWDGRSDRGDRVRAGVYWLRVAAGGVPRLARIVRVD